MFCALVISIFFTSCKSENDVVALNTDVVQIETGHSFGMCFGLTCYVKLVIDGGKATLMYQERKIVDGKAEFKGRQRTVEVDKEDINKELGSLSSANFKKLEDRYGCPDCADGGAEWVKVVFADGTNKEVMFEYGKTVDGIGGLIEALRKERLYLAEKIKE